MADWAFPQVGPDLVSASEVIRNFAVGLGVLVGLPILGIVWRAAQTVKAIQNTAEGTNEKLLEFMDRVGKILERHDGDIEELKLDRARNEGFVQGRQRGAQRFDDIHPEPG